jgi:hypothetical protein
MLAALTGILHKLWNRGIDIGVGVITSVFIAGIGLLFWRVKLWLDLRADERRQRQQHRIAEEIEALKRRDAARQNRQQLSADVDRFAKQAEASATAFHLADCWEHYYKWLIVNGLDGLPGNLKIIVEHSAWGAGLRGTATHGQVIGPAAQEVARVIRTTELPPVE